MKNWSLSAVAAAALCLPTGLVMAQDTPAPQGEEKKEGAEGAEGAEGGTRERPQEQPERPQRRSRRGFGGFDMTQYKDQLGLTDEQMKQFDDLQTEMRAQWEKFNELRQAGDREAMREFGMKMREQMGEMRTKMESVLTDEQREKMTKIREEQRSRWQQRRGNRGSRGRSPQQNRQRLRAEAEKALSLSEEEAAVVMPLLDTVLETRELLTKESERRRNEFLKKVREADPQNAEALNTLLSTYRDGVAKDKQTLTQAMAQLREVLTSIQEAHLVGLNILD